MSVYPLAEKYPDSSPYVYVSNNPLNLIDPTGMGEEKVNDWYKDLKGVIRYDENVKTQADVDKISPGGNYIADEFSTKTANYYKDGSAFFKNEHEGYQFMIDNSNMDKKNATEHVGWITQNGVAVLPTKGKDMWGNDFENTSLHSELNVKGYMWLGSGQNLTVNFHGKKLSPIAWIHTHPDHFGGFGQSAGDTGTTNTLSIPSIVIGRDSVWGQSVKNANKNLGGSEVMSRAELKSGEISIIGNIKLLRK
ncbi:hypothetical protein FB1_29590 [Flavobacterium branchiophilum NBRC 15030 = ATCC 35035]|nr:hypothetical protein FB1_29590 [Flavobacterium branchiophilum NBRC 15030 = ATCC 35035]